MHRRREPGRGPGRCPPSRSVLTGLFAILSFFPAIIFFEFIAMGCAGERTHRRGSSGVGTRVPPSSHPVQLCSRSRSWVGKDAWIRRFSPQGGRHQNSRRPARPHRGRPRELFFSLQLVIRHERPNWLSARESRKKNSAVVQNIWWGREG